MRKCRGKTAVRLHPRVQGLEALVYGGEARPPFSLVSNGVECLMLRRDFYEKHASQLQLVFLRDDVSGASTVHCS